MTTLVRRLGPAMVSAILLLAGCGGSASPASAPASPSAAAKAQASASTAPASTSAKPQASAAAAPASAAAKAQASASGSLTKLEIIYSSNTGPDNVPAWSALDAGYFQKNGLDVNLQYIAGGTKVIEALIANQAQAGLQGGNEVMSADASGADLVLIAGLLPIYAYKLEAHSGINSIEDLKGKKLGVSTIGGSADVALRGFLTKHNINPDKDVTIVATGDPATTQAALLSGAIQASLSVPPNSLKAEASGLHEIADLASDKIPNAQNSLTVHRSWLNANRPVAQELVDSLIEGLARIKHDKAFAEGIMKKYLKYSDQKGLDATYDYFSTEVWPDYPHVRADQLADGLAVLSKKNDKLKGFDPNSIIDDSLVQDAEKRGVAGK